MDVLRQEIHPFGIRTTIVNPGFFRTELISEKLMTFAESTIADYQERRERQSTWWRGHVGKKPGNPTKLAKALVDIVQMNAPPTRFVAGADVTLLAERNIENLPAAIDLHRRLSEDMGFDS